MENNINLYDKTIIWLKNNRIIGVILLLIFLYLGIGKIIDSFEKIEKGGLELGFFSKKNKEPENVKLFTAEDRIVKERSSSKYIVVDTDKPRYGVTGIDNNGDDEIGVLKSNGLKALISIETGDTIIGFKYHDIRVRYKNDGSLPKLINVMNKNGFWGLIDDKGQVKVPCSQSEIIGFYDSNFAVLSGYIIDRNGNQIVPAHKYYCAYPFKEGLAPVAIKGPITEFMPAKGDETYSAPKPVWGFIDTLGNETIPCKFDFVTHFTDGIATVFLNGRCMKIAKSGAFLSNCNEEYEADFFPSPDFPLISK